MPDADTTVTVSTVDYSGSMLNDYVGIHYAWTYNGTYVNDDRIRARMGGSDSYPSVINDTDGKMVTGNLADFYDLSLGGRYDFIIEVPSGCTLTSITGADGYEKIDDTHYAGFIIIPENCTDDYFVIDITPDS